MPDQPNGTQPPAAALVSVQLSRWRAQVVDGHDELNRPVKAMLVESVDNGVQIVIPGINAEAAQVLADALLKPPTDLVIPPSIILPP